MDPLENTVNTYKYKKKRSNNREKFEGNSVYRKI